MLVMKETQSLAVEQDKKLNPKISNPEPKKSDLLADKRIYIFMPISIIPSYDKLIIFDQ